MGHILTLYYICTMYNIHRVIGIFIALGVHCFSENSLFLLLKSGVLLLFLFYFYLQICVHVHVCVFEHMDTYVPWPMSEVRGQLVGVGSLLPQVLLV